MGGLLCLVQGFVAGMIFATVGFMLVLTWRSKLAKKTAAKPRSKLDFATLIIDTEKFEALMIRLERIDVNSNAVIKIISVDSGYRYVGPTKWFPCLIIYLFEAGYINVVGLKRVDLIETMVIKIKTDGILASAVDYFKLGEKFRDEKDDDWRNSRIIDNYAHLAEKIQDLI